MRPTMLSDLGLSAPVLAAPLAGGPGTPDLVIAASRAGGMGFIAGGYRSAQELAEQLAAVRVQPGVFGVNLFAPSPVPVDRDRYGVDLPVEPVEDDDGWHEKVDLLLSDPVPVVSFTFGIPARDTLAALRAAGSMLIQTVTSADEAVAAAEAGVDALAVQASAAGGHSGTLSPDRVPAARSLTDLVHDIAQRVTLPLVAAGGLVEASQVAAVVRAGAEAVMVGTVLLRSPESGATEAHRAALADPHRGDTVVTRAFTGRPARALRNTFIDRYDVLAPAGYPALHYLTRPLRKAAAAAADPEYVNLWAGTGYRRATDEPAEQILRRLAAELG